MTETGGRFSSSAVSKDSELSEAFQLKEWAAL